MQQLTDVEQQEKKLFLGDEMMHSSQERLPSLEEQREMKELLTLYENYSKNGQKHLFKYWDTLSTSEKAQYKEQISSFDPKVLREEFLKANDTLQNTLNSNNKLNATKSTKMTSTPTLEPFPSSMIDSIERNTKDGLNNLKKWNNIGLKLISEGKLAVILLAGGQGTRLGSSLPKACYEIGPISQKSLLQIQAERISKIKSMAASLNNNKIYLPWYIMTSEKTHDQTLNHLKKNNYFGLDKSEITLFNQGLMPAFHTDGTLIMESKHSLSLSPNGNGGVYDALKKSNVLKQLTDSGIQYVHIYCVDNVLCKVADPAFVGYAHDLDADVAVKAVKKTVPTEKAGVFCLKDGFPAVAEYSELPENLAKAESSPGNLLFDAANIANHLLSIKFLNQIVSFSYTHPYHVSHKKIKCIDQDGNFISPTEPNGIKLEKFLFDVFSSSSKFKILIVDRDDEFMALKNSSGSKDDSPEHCKTMLINQSNRYLLNSGAILLDSNKNPIDSHNELSSFSTYIELSPLNSYRGEGLEMLKGKVITAPVYINNLNDILNQQ